MRKIIRSAVFLALMGLLFVHQAKAAEAGGDSVNKHSFTLTHWKYSSQSEQRAFIMGFIAALDMERMWQGDKPQPVGKSLVGVWTRGLNGLSYPEVCDAVNAYIEQNPDKMDEDVLKVLAGIYVRPKMTPAECKEAGDHYVKIHGGR